MRSRAPCASNVSLTVSTHATWMPADAPTANSAEASISTARAPSGAPSAVAHGVALVEEVGADDAPLVTRPPACRPPVRRRSRRLVAQAAAALQRADQRVGEARVSSCQRARAQRRARPVGRDRLARDDQVAERERLVQGTARADPDRARHPERDQLVQHDRGARAAHAGALDRERLAVGGRRRIAPQPAMVVEHQRVLQQKLRQRQRPARVARQQRALGQRRRRAQVDRLAVGRGDRLVAVRWIGSLWGGTIGSSPARWIGSL